jgi:hypothetical protein
MFRISIGFERLPLSQLVLGFGVSAWYDHIIQVNLEIKTQQPQFFTLFPGKLAILDIEVFMANPNPSPKTRYQTYRAEPLTHVVAVKVGNSMKAELDRLDNAAEFVRQAIAEKLQELESESKPA